MLNTLAAIRKLVISVSEGSWYAFRASYIRASFSRYSFVLYFSIFYSLLVSSLTYFLDIRRMAFGIVVNLVVKLVINIINTPRFLVFFSLGVKRDPTD